MPSVPVNAGQDGWIEYMNIDAVIKDPSTEKLVIFGDGQVPLDVQINHPQYKKLIEDSIRTLEDLDESVFTDILSSKHVDGAPALHKAFTKDNLLSVFKKGSG